MAKIFRNYNTLAEFNSESVHPENKICFIKDKGVLYLNGVQYSPSKMDTIDNIGDSDSIVNKFNEFRNNLLKSNLMTARTPNNIVYWTGDSNTIRINYNDYTAESNSIIIDGVGCYKLKLYKDLDNNFYTFTNNSFTNLIFKDVDTSNVTNMAAMFYACGALTSLDLSGFDTSNVTNMAAMFYACGALTSLDTSGWDTSNVTDINYMFYSC
ncbi:MAG: BspA family leucine-rich repeat surface protein, partial [Lachnospira sp.]|nr:BspA family leucine-rich repeat surface protein [Lachnospira sp.]